MRSLLAVVAGFAAMAVTVIVATIVLAELLYPEAKDSPTTPTSAWLAVNFAYSFAAAALGGWVAARLAPRAPFGHAVALAALALAFALPGIVGGAQPGQPAWYPPVLAALALAGILIGGRFAARRAAAP
jgi:hypothetical protein